MRTFNTAPITTNYESICQKIPGLLSQFVNYRVSSDVVSDLPFEKYPGNTFVFPGRNKFWNSHSMGAVHQHIPSNITELTVGSGDGFMKVHNQLVEMIYGLLFSYQCRIDGQFFSRYRAGVKNLAEIKHHLPEILRFIGQKNYDQALVKLADLKEKVHGNFSTGIVDVLMLSTAAVKIDHKRVEANTAENSVVEEQHQMKAKLQEQVAPSKDLSNSDGNSP